MVAIADDLTGAVDCAAPCAAHGMAVTVVLHRSLNPDSGLHWSEVDVVSIDANTRGAVAEQAAETTAAVVEQCRAQANDAILFKKIDSTLRGNLAAEVAATLRAYRSTSGKKNRAMILAPALPSQGRTTIGGRQFVHGRMLEETDLWKSEDCSPRSSIAEVLAEGGVSCRVVDLAIVRAGAGRLLEELATLATQVDVLICDAETDGDLRAIAVAATTKGHGFDLWAGAAGLAAQFPSAMGLKKRRRSDRIAFASGPSLFVVGSAASISHAQVNALAAEPDVVRVCVSVDALHNAGAGFSEVVERLQRGSDTLVVFDGSEAWSRSHAQAFAGALSRLIKPCADLLGGLVATGGETARALLDGLAIDRLQLLGELEPGLPFSVADGWRRPLPVLTKAGAFGSPEALIHCREFLRKLERPAEGQTLFLTRED